MSKSLSWNDLEFVSEFGHKGFVGLGVDDLNRWSYDQCSKNGWWFYHQNHEIKEHRVLHIATSEFVDKYRRSGGIWEYDRF